MGNLSRRERGCHHSQYTNACNLNVSFLNIFNADGVRNLLGFQSEAKIFVRNQCCKRLLFIKVNTNVIFWKKKMICIICNLLQLKHLNSYFIKKKINKLKYILIYIFFKIIIQLLYKTFILASVWNPNRFLTPSALNIFKKETSKLQALVYWLWWHPRSRRDKLPMDARFRDQATFRKAPRKRAPSYLQRYL